MGFIQIKRRTSRSNRGASTLLLTFLASGALLAATLSVQNIVSKNSKQKRSLLISTSQQNIVKNIETVTRSSQIVQTSLQNALNAANSTAFSNCLDPTNTNNACADPGYGNGIEIYLTDGTTTYSGTIASPALYAPDGTICTGSVTDNCTIQVSTKIRFICLYGATSCARASGAVVTYTISANTAATGNVGIKQKSSSIYYYTDDLWWGNAGQAQACPPGQLAIGISGGGTIRCVTGTNTTAITQNNLSAQGTLRVGIPGSTINGTNTWAGSYPTTDLDRWNVAANAQPANSTIAINDLLLNEPYGMNDCNSLGPAGPYTNVYAIDGVQCFSEYSLDPNCSPTNPASTSEKVEYAGMANFYIDNNFNYQIECMKGMPLNNVAPYCTYFKRAYIRFRCIK